MYLLSIYFLKIQLYCGMMKLKKLLLLILELLLLMKKIYYLSLFHQKNLKVKYLINTHCHIDHILGCKFIKEKFNPVYFAPEKDLPLLEHAQEQASMFDISLDKPPKPDELITEETELVYGKI